MIGNSNKSLKAVLNNYIKANHEVQNKLTEISEQIDSDFESIKVQKSINELEKYIDKINYNLKNSISTSLEKPKKNQRGKFFISFILNKINILIPIFFVLLFNLSIRSSYFIIWLFLGIFSLFLLTYNSEKNT